MLGRGDGKVVFGHLLFNMVDLVSLLAGWLSMDLLEYVKKTKDGHKGS